MEKKCDKFKKQKNLYNICTGNTDLPKWKVNQYRLKLGIPPLYKNIDFNPPCTKSTPKVVQVKSSKEKNSAYDFYPPGVGTELLKIYEKAGVPTCSKCIDLAMKMNEWGVNGCTEKMDLILEDILPRARAWIKDNQPWIDKLFPNVIEDLGIKMKVKLDINRAISNYKNNKKNPAKIKRLRRSGGCGCGKK